MLLKGHPFTKILINTFLKRQKKLLNNINAGVAERHCAGLESPCAVRHAWVQVPPPAFFFETLSPGR